jgi:hypothetical protein
MYLFIGDTLLDGIDKLDRAARLLAKQMGVSRSSDIWGEIASDNWRLVRRQDAMFPVWKRVQVGKCQTEDSYLNEVRCLQSKGSPVEVGRYAKALFPKVTFSTIVHTCDVVLISPEKIGINDRIDYSQFVEKVLSFGGYSLCSAEVALMLRLQFLDQTRLSSDCVVVAMNPLSEYIADGTQKSVFVLEHNGDSLMLDTVELGSFELHPEYQVAFVRK